MQSKRPTRRSGDGRSLGAESAATWSRPSRLQTSRRIPAPPAPATAARVPPRHHRRSRRAPTAPTALTAPTAALAAQPPALGQACPAPRAAAQALRRRRPASAQRRRERRARGCGGPAGGRARFGRGRLRPSSVCCASSCARRARARASRGGRVRAHESPQRQAGRRRRRCSRQIWRRGRAGAGRRRSRAGRAPGPRQPRRRPSQSSTGRLSRCARAVAPAGPRRRAVRARIPHLSGRRGGPGAGASPRWVARG